MRVSTRSPAATQHQCYPNAYPAHREVMHGMLARTVENHGVSRGWERQPSRGTRGAGLGGEGALEVTDKSLIINTVPLNPVDQYPLEYPHADTALNGLTQKADPCGLRMVAQFEAEECPARMHVALVYRRVRRAVSPPASPFFRP